MISSHIYKLFYCEACNNKYYGNNYKIHLLTTKHKKQEQIYILKQITKKIYNN